MKYLRIDLKTANPPKFPAIQYISVHPPRAALDDSTAK